MSEELKDFKTWWAESEIFAGEGSMDAAEQAWDAAEELTSKRCMEQAVEGVKNPDNIFFYPDEFGNTALIAVDDAEQAIREKLGGE